MKKFTVLFIKLLLCITLGAISYWFVLPPLNLRSPEFWGYAVFLMLGCVAIIAFSDIFVAIKNQVQGKQSIKTDFKTKFRRFSLPIKVAVFGVALYAIVLIVGSVIGSEFFNAKRYNRLLTMNNSDFSVDVAEISRDQIPVVDRETASRLGLRKLGEISDLVSQFEVLDDYTQINYHGKPVRVTPLAYGDAIKWLNNQKNGIPAYITVDMTTQETALVRLEQGMKYSETEYFMRNVYRRLRFSYPTKIFDEVSFEIDENGTPYWVASTIKYRIGLFSGRDIEGAVLLNAITGESEFYPVGQIPTWVDQVYSADMIINQLNLNGKYRSGFWNSIFGQKGVLQTTEGYNYLAINDDVWLYTGVTSVGRDESNVGFVLVNLRTKETRYYAIPGAEEYSAMSSAQGQVQHLGYKATFPLLLNVSGRPSYFMSLKDAAGLVKMYAFVDVQQYQIVGTGSTIAAAQEDYLIKLNADSSVTVDGKEETAVGTIEKIASAVIDGNTTYYIMLNENDTVFTVTAEKAPALVFAEKGNTVEITYSIAGSIVTVNSVTVK